ncbi:MAG: hypothetical protein LUC44_06160 [Prevotellaceae bacterium]|nr:hypothetical protein [Prevotellaceae bacterium]
MGWYDRELQTKRDNAENELYTAYRELGEVDGYRAYDDEEKEEMKADIKAEIDRLEERIRDIDAEIEWQKNGREEEERFRRELCHSQGLWY